MKDKTILITGATSGIGKETARALAEQGAEVIFTARTEAKAQAALADLKEHTGSEQISYFLCDFTSQEAIHSLAKALTDEHSHLDVLVNNAGAVFASRQETKEGIERTFAVNHLGYFLLTHLLFDLLKAAPTARIVNVASDAHKAVKEINIDDLGFKQGYSIMKAYGLSKVANIMFTYELARKLEGSNVTVNALHPGFVATNIGANTIPMIGKAIKWLVNLTAKDVKTGAQTSIYLASSPEIEGVSGKYFSNCKETPSNKISYDQSLQKKLWEISASMTSLN